MNIYLEPSHIRKNEPKFNENQTEQLIVNINDLITFNTSEAIRSIRTYILDCFSNEISGEVILNICIDKLYTKEEIKNHVFKFLILKRYIDYIYNSQKNFNVYVNFRGIFQVFEKIDFINPIVPLLTTDYETVFDIENIIELHYDSLNEVKYVESVFNATESSVIDRIIEFKK